MDKGNKWGLEIGGVTKYCIGGWPVQPMPPIAVFSHNLKFADVTKVFCGVSNAVTIKVPPDPLVWSGGTDRSTGPNAEAAQNEIIYYIKLSKQNIFEKNQPRLKLNTITLSVSKHRWIAAGVGSSLRLVD